MSDEVVNDRRTIMWERRAAFVATVGLVAALVITLAGYIFLLALDRATGTLDNLASLAIGAVAGATSGTAATALMRRPQVESLADGSDSDLRPIKWPPELPDEVVGR